MIAGRVTCTATVQMVDVVSLDAQNRVSIYSGVSSIGACGEKFCVCFAHAGHAPPPLLLHTPLSINPGSATDILI